MPRLTVGSTHSPSRDFPCPIPGCTKLFHGTRGGWDAHVGSVTRHPDWHPELEDSQARRRQFAIEYPHFLR
jgi:hypothetical protein